MTIAARSTGGHVRSSLVLLAASLVAVAVPAAARATRGLPAAVRPAQELVALLRPHEARSAPSEGSQPLGLVPSTTPITGMRTVLPVLARRGQWLKVRLPGRPNGHAGWIDGTATARSSTAWHIVVDLSRRQMTVYQAGRPVLTESAVVGKPSTPTPRGEFFVEEGIALGAGDVGAPYALALSARSNVLQEFEGGPGQIALHGLANVGGVPGTAVSHGCVRLANDVMRWLVRRIVTGTPVTITA